MWYFGGGSGRQQAAVHPHVASAKGVEEGEISLEVGDVVGVAGNHWDGFAKGKNARTGKTGLFPAYKAANLFRKAEYSVQQEEGS